MAISGSHFPLRLHSPGQSASVVEGTTTKLQDASAFAREGRLKLEPGLSEAE